MVLVWMGVFFCGFEGRNAGGGNERRLSFWGVFFSTFFVSFSGAAMIYM